MSETLSKWLESEKHLPRPLRDFHRAKDVFKSLHDWIGKPVAFGYPDVLLRRLEREGCSPETIEQVRAALRISWVDGHCYVIDYFLKFMAACGWTLQRSRKRVEYASLAETIEQRRARETAVLKQAFASRADVAAAP